MVANLPDSYQSLATLGTSDEIVINKSKFIGYAKMALTEKEALAYIDKVKAQHPLASCICYGYVCEYQNQVQKYHDGHEPVGGKPILSAIKLKKLIGTTCVVVRYYGGIKLGVGSLARAFSNAAVAAIQNGKPSLYELGKEIAVTYSYVQDGKICYLLENSELVIGEKEYLEKISLNIHIKNKHYDELINKLTSITNDTHNIKLIEEKYMC